LIYIFSNLAAFGVAAVISEKTGKENIDEYKGLYKTNPFLSWMLVIALFSLAGIPPTDFFWKTIFADSGSVKGNFWLILIAGLNMVISFLLFENCKSRFYG
jgi:NADH-quinone oxidoreductase subunit N